MSSGRWGELLRFCLVGVVNTATYYGSYLLLRELVPYLAAHVMAFLVSMTGSFLLNCAYTFRTRPTWRKFALFPLTVAGNFAFTTVGVAVLVELVGVDDRLAPLLAGIAAIPITLVATRLVLLGRRPAPVA